MATSPHNINGAHHSAHGQPERHFIPRKPISGSLVSPVSPQTVSTPRGEAQTAPWTPRSKSQPHIVTQPVPTSSRLSRLGGPWAWEVASLLFAFACLAGVIVLLAVYEGNQLPNWPALVSINSLIAVLTSAMKAGLLLPIAEGISELKWIWFATAHPLNDLARFDEASRGPLGALKFMIRWPRHLATLGAAIMILAIAIDPFTQQVVQYYSCLTQADDISASIARVNNYNITQAFVGEVLTYLDGTMSAAIYQGLLQPPANSSVGVPFTCPTGNCTFYPAPSTYRSLAICTEVQDFSHLVTGGGSQPNEEGPPQWSYVLNWDAGNISVTNNGGGGGDALAVNVLQNLSSLSNGTRPATIFSMAGLTLTGAAGDIYTSISKGSLKPFAFGASLYPCIKTYRDANITQFVLSETVDAPIPLVSNVGEFSLVGDHPAVPGRDCNPSPKRTDNKTTPTTTLPNGDVILDQSNQPAAAWYDPACSWHFYSLTAVAIQTFLQTLFSKTSPGGGSSSPSNGGDGLFGEGSGSGGSSGSSIGGSTDQSTQPNYLTFQDDSTDVVFGDLWLQRLYANHSANISSVTAYMQGLADAMTTVVRTHGDSGAVGPAQGSVLLTQTCVGVAWPWLALPATLLLLATAFLLVTMVYVARRVRPGGSEPGRGVWKSSPLPLLWCELPDEVRRNSPTLDTTQKMKDVSSDTYVSLGRRTDFHGVDDVRSPRSYANLESAAGQWMWVEHPTATRSNKEDEPSRASRQTTRQIGGRRAILRARMARRKSKTQE